MESERESTGAESEHVREGEREGERKRKKERERGRKREKEEGRERKTESERERERKRKTERERERATEKDKERERKSEKERERQRKREKDRGREKDKPLIHFISNKTPPTKKKKPKFPSPRIRLESNLSPRLLPPQPPQSLLWEGPSLHLPKEYLGRPSRQLRP